MSDDVYVFPMSAAQARLWFLHELEPHSAAYNLPAAARLRGALDVPSAERAIAEIIRRHEALRTTLAVVDGELSQVVAEAASPALSHFDLRALPEAQRKDELRRLLAREVKRPFPLASGPLVRVALVRTGDDEHVLLWVVHHAVFDGWSTAIVLAEFARAYAAFARGEGSPLRPLTLQYADFAEWEQKRLASARSAEQLAYWRNTLAPVDVQLELPTDRARPVLPQKRGARHFFRLPLPEREALAALAESRATTLYAVLLAGYHALLARYTGARDVRVGTPVTLRNRVELEAIVGCFVNTVVVRCELAPEQPFTQLLALVDEAVRAAQENQDVPFDRVVEALAPTRDLGRSPLYQVLFALQPALGAIPAIPGLALEVLDLDTGATQLDLSLELALDDDGLEGAVEYDCELFEPATITQLAQHYRRLLAAAAEAPETPIGRLSLLAADERARLLERAASPLPRSEPAPVLAAIFAQAERRPQATALVHEGRTLSYGELAQRVLSLASHLRTHGVGPELRVGVCLPRSIAQIVAVLGVLEAHGAYVPLDPTLPRARIAALVEEARLALVLSDDPQRELLPNGTPVLALDAELTLLSALPAAAPARAPHAAQSAYVLYTSGSTGVPKGVVVPQRALARFVDSAATLYGLGPSDRVLQFASLAFDASVEEIFPCLTRGATLVLRDEAMIASPAQFLAATRELGITVLDLPTSFFHRLMADQHAISRLPESVRAVILGGEAALPDRVQRFCRERGARTQLFNTYGPTECTVVATACALSAADAEGARALPIGSPLPAVQAYVVDAVTLELVPPGVSGELLLGGEGLAHGYAERPALTAERFVPNPFACTPGERLYRTGDRVRLRRDGSLEFVGRSDRQVKLRGFRIEVEEVEARLLALSGVAECAVELRGESDERRLLGYVAGAARDGELLRAALFAQLPDHMVPAQIVLLEALPRTLQGKIDRRALPEPLRTREVERAPMSELERELQQLFSELLGKGAVGLRENFFALGGDSIVSLQLVARARERGLDLTPRLVFQHQTIEALAAATKYLATGGAGASTAAPAPLSGELPLTPIQRWFFARMDAQPHHWNQSLLLKARAPLDFAALQAAVEAVAARHDALRLSFTRERDGWRQRYASRPALCVLREAVAEVATDALAEAISRIAGRHQAALHVEQGPLLRVVAIDCGQEEPARLLIAVHHLVVDAVSFRILLDELAAAYAQARAGRAIALPATSAPFAAWARLAASASQFDSATDAQSPSEPARYGKLPVDEPSGAALEGATVQIVQRFSVAATARMLAALPVYRLRLDELLLAALADTLRTVCAHPRVLIEREGHGRDLPAARELDLSRTVGWFTALERVGLDLSGCDDEDALLCAVKEQLRSDQREPSVVPDVSFNYLGSLDLGTGDAPFVLADEDAGAERAAAAPRGYELELDAAIVQGALRITYSFSAERQRVATIEALRDAFAERLEALVALCLRPGAGRATPSDFPLADVTPAQLAELAQGDALEDLYPLSALQQGLLFHSLWEPDESAYVEQVSCTLEGALDLAALGAAWEQVLALHPALRTTFVWQGLDAPLQRVPGTAPLELTVEDLRTLPSEAQASALAARAQADKQRGFELARGPLMRLALVKLEDDRHHFTWTHHHLILDGWSAAIVLRDVFAAYEAHVRGAATRLPPALRYRDFVAFQRDARGEESREFWRGQLAGFREATPLPLALPVQRPERSGIETVRRALPSALATRLSEFARRHQLTLATLVEGAWAFVLARSAGVRDVLFGVTVAGRSAPLAGIEQAVGLFINTLPLRVRVEDDADVRAFLAAIAHTKSERQPHEYSALTELRALSEVEQGAPLFESLLVFENYPADARLHAGFAGLHVSDAQFDEETHYPLTLTVSLEPSLELRLGYARRRFTDQAAPRLLALLEQTLVELARAPEARLGALRLVEHASDLSRLAGFNATEVSYPARGAVHQQFEAVARAEPTRTALIFECQRLSYGELNARANQLARVLRQRGVTCDSLVAVALERSVELVVALLAVLKAGAAYVPIDPEYPPVRIAFMLEDAAAPVLVSTWPVAAGLGVSGELVCVDADRAEIGSEPEHDLGLAIHPEQLAYTIYTSGSTGRPKGAGNSHRALENRLAWMQAAYALTPEDRVLQKTPFSFDVSVWELFWPLANGATLVVARPGDHRDPARLAEVIRAHDVTTLHFVPPMLEAFLESDEASGCSTLRRIVCSGEALSAELARRCLARFDLALENLYGPTEAAIDVSAWTCAREDDSAPLPIGRPIANTQLYVLDRAGQPLPHGVAGELYIGGVQLARGYHRRPALTAERFVPDPFSALPGARLYRTGDLVRQRADGVIEFLGRLDHQVKIRGLRVELGEIEARLLAHAGVREAITVARDEPSGAKRLLAYVSGDELPDTEVLRAWLGRTLPAFMVPSTIVTLPRLPLSPNGKVDRRALPAPESATLSSAPYVAPRSELERTLSEVWSQVLRRECVGIDDDFFALGGDSIVSLQILARAAQRGISFTPKQLFEQPTIRALAALLAALPVDAAPDSPPPSQIEPAPEARLSEDEWRDLLAELER